MHVDQGWRRSGRGGSAVEVDGGGAFTGFVVGMVA